MLIDYQSTLTRYMRNYFRCDGEPGENLTSCVPNAPEPPGETGQRRERVIITCDGWDSDGSIQRVQIDTRPGVIEDKVNPMRVTAVIKAMVIAIQIVRVIDGKTVGVRVSSSVVFPADNRPTFSQRSDNTCCVRCGD